MLEVLVVVNATSYTPLPVMREVTSTLVHVPEEKFPEEPMTEPTAGALANVIEPSSQLWLETCRTW
jgi:hypothetical protein